MNKKALVYLVIIIAIALIFVLAPNTLEIELIKEPLVPLGTLITWILFIIWTLFFFTLTFSDISLETQLIKGFKVFFNFLLFISVIWGFIGFYLANNWTYTFSGNASSFRGSYEASKIFWNFNYALLIIPLVSFFIIFIINKIKK